MVAEVLEHLAPSRGGVFVDCTVGLGGHARAIVEAGASRVIGLDRDQQALEQAGETLRDVQNAVDLVHEDYRRFADVLKARGIGPADLSGPLYVVMSRCHNGLPLPSGRRCY